MSKGKDIRAEFETQTEDAARNWLDAKQAGDSAAEIKQKRLIFRTWATALAILIDPEDAENTNAIVSIEKEYLGRVRD